LGDPLTWGFCSPWSRLTAGASSSNVSRTPRGTTKLQLQLVQLTPIHNLDMALALRQADSHRQLAAFAELTSRLAPSSCKVTSMCEVETM